MSVDAARPPRVLRAMLGSVAFPMVDRAEGVHLWDTDGRRYLDASGGPFACSFGHGIPEVADAIAEQARRIALSTLHNEPAEELAEMLLADAPRELAGVFYTNGGSEAVEAAMKLASHYHYARGEPGRDRFVAVTDAYHGTTLGAVSVTGHPLFRERTGWESMLLPVHHVPVPDARDPEAAARALEAVIRAEGAHRVAAFVCEPIFEWVDPGARWFAAVREVCDRHGVLLIVDEVRTCCGKMGAPYGVQVRDVVPDILLFGKGVSGGYSPIAGMAVRDRIVETLRERGAHFYHGHTFAGNPLSCATALAVQRHAHERGLYDRVPRVAEGLRRVLDDIVERHPNALSVHGVGVLQFLKLEPPESTSDRWRLFPLLFEEGLVAAIVPTGGFLGLGFAPPYIFTDEDFAELSRSLDAVVRRFAG